MSIEDVQKEIVLWQSDNFPGSTLVGICNHMIKEAKEAQSDSRWVEHYQKYEDCRLIATESEFAEELADVMFTVFHAAHLAGVDLEHELRSKLAKNKLRTWPKEPGEDGCYHHEK